MDLCIDIYLLTEKTVWMDNLGTDASSWDVEHCNGHGTSRNGSSTLQQTKRCFLNHAWISSFGPIRVNSTTEIAAENTCRTLLSCCFEPLQLFQALAEKHRFQEFCRNNGDNECARYYKIFNILKMYLLYIIMQLKRDADANF